MTTSTESASPDMDPRLQMAVACAKTGAARVATASSSVDEIAVVAKVTDVEAWEGLSEVRIGARIGAAEEGGQIVTARVPVRRIEAVRTQPFVTSLKPAQSVRLALGATIQETNARADLLPSHTDPRGGLGVVVGIIDFGCDFLHENFRYRTVLRGSKGFGTKPPRAGPRLATGAFLIDAK